MITPISSAGIILSYKCNSKCRHCLYCCSNEWDEWMNADDLISIFEGIHSTTKQLMGFHFAGGEAFLNFPLLLEAVKLAHKYKLPIDYVETNGGWYTDKESALEKLTQLKKAGLDCLLVSASYFHAEHISVKKTVGVINASLKVFGHHGTMVWLPEFIQDLTEKGIKDIIDFDHYFENMNEKARIKAASYFGRLIAGGRSAYSVAKYLPKVPKEELFNGTCYYELLKSSVGHFDLYGNIIPGICAGISIGNCMDLESSYKNFNLDDYPLVKTLCQGGVKGLFEIAVSQYDYKPHERYINKCHLCMDIRKHLFYCNAPYSELKPADFYKRI